MKIEVLGPGCPKCHDTFERVRQVLDELKLEAELMRSRISLRLSIRVSL